MAMFVYVTRLPHSARFFFGGGLNTDSKEAGEAQKRRLSLKRGRT